ncbi:MAG TPA: hypothetical protein VGJ08_00045 [Rhizomicrobium sp.]
MASSTVSTRDKAMNRIVVLAASLPFLLSADGATSIDFSADITHDPTVLTGPIIGGWTPVGTAAAYLFAGQVDRATAGGARDWTVLTVGAQFNAINRRGVNQVVFGTATEAWAEQGSFSMLTGLEATTINREPDNPWRKISVWSTFKNRPDTEYSSPPSDPANMGSQALRIESQPGTGFERGIVFAPTALYPSRKLERPVAIDLSEISDEQIGGIDIVRVRKNLSVRFDPRTKMLVVVHTDE